MKRFGLFFVFALLLTLPSAVHAQIGIYGAVSGAALSSAPKDVGYGGMVGAYKQSGHFLATGLDLRGTFLGREGFHYYTYAIGPRIAFKPRVLPISPYVEGMIGLANYNNGKNTNSSNHLNYQVLGGVDATIMPRIDWRIIDVAYSGVGGESISAMTFSTGLVIRVW
ncbi:MAG: hypothetical protein PW789_09010 [Edaphobacter sp.]|uniref:hypothetical protein n=1 Tax=Edaphobacter sp. TaxID=1934404 RepID=UPI00239A24A4|nr:hypothetical protein [Edaphobacter sp.]MDE1176735.1 hypothetical protein [Edaphobacter sp.]